LNVLLVIARLDEAHMPFNFQFVTMEHWGADTIRACVDAYEKMLPAGAWPNWVLGNHDRQRIATRIGLDQARVALMLLLTLRGTPTCYYGDELGMENVPIPVAMINDPPGKRDPLKSRDPERTPMQWNPGPNAGFSAPGIQTWLPIASNYQTQNVESEQQDPYSMLSFVHALLALRREMPALNIGTYGSIADVPEGCFAFLRKYDEQTLLVVLNCSVHDIPVSLPQLGEGNILLSTHMKSEGKVTLNDLQVPANEGYIIALQ
jgi:Glycosidases